MRFLTVIVHHNFSLKIPVALEAEEAMGEVKELGELRTLGELGELGELEPMLHPSELVVQTPEPVVQNLPELPTVKGLTMANPLTASWSTATKCP